MKITPANSTPVSQSDLPAANPPMDNATSPESGKRVHDAVQQAFTAWTSAKAAIPSQPGFPALDAGSKDPGYIDPAGNKNLPRLDANANAVAIEHLKLENEGWERDKRRG